MSTRAPSPQRLLIANAPLNHMTRLVAENDSFTNKVLFGCTMQPLSPNAQVLARYAYVAPAHYSADLVNCDLRQLSYNRAELTDVTFENCDLTGAHLVHTVLKNVTFTNCNLENTDFVASLLQQVTITNCVLTGANFAKTSSVDLTIDASPEQLCAMRLHGAAGFPGPLPEPYYHTMSIPYPAGLDPWPTPTELAPIVNISHYWIKTLSQSNAVPESTITALLREHPETSPRDLYALVRAVSPECARATS